MVDLNKLITAYKNSIKDSKWKPSVQSFNLNYLVEVNRAKNEIENETYKTSKTSRFIIHERGKTRVISGNTVIDRTVRHYLCDEILMPQIKPKLIYDNGSSIKGKGVDFTRKRLRTHLHRFYRKYGNKGYILIGDFTKFYDNIKHDKAYQMLEGYVDDTWKKVLQDIFDSFKVDVSFLSDEQYSKCMDMIFNSLKYEAIDDRFKTGEKFMNKSVKIGDQTSQILGIYYPHRIDNYVKIVRGMKFYARYTDDFYIMSPSKEELWDILENIKNICKEYGIFLNEKKTVIVRLDKKFHFLQNSYQLTDSGHIIEKLNKKRLVAMRRKLKKFRRKLDGGEITYEAIEQVYKSWIGGYKKYLSKRQLLNLEKLFNTLFKES